MQLGIGFVAGSEVSYGHSLNFKDNYEFEIRDILNHDAIYQKLLLSSNCLEFMRITINDSQKNAIFS